MRLHNQSRIARSQRIRAAIFLVLVPLFLIAGVPEARADASASGPATSFPNEAAGLTAFVPNIL